MAKPGYRENEKQVQVWVTKTLHINMLAASSAQGISMQKWMVEAFREKVARNGDRVDDPADAAVDAVERADEHDAARDRDDAAGGTVGDVGEQRTAVRLVTARWGELNVTDLDPFDTLTAVTHLGESA